MEYNHLQYQDQTNSGALHAEEYTHMNDTAFLLYQDVKKKIKNRPTDPPDF